MGRPRRAARRSPPPSSAARTRSCGRSSTGCAACYALARVEAERGFYQEHGRLSSHAGSKAVIKAVNALCAELRADAGAARRRLRRARRPATARRAERSRREPAPARRARAPDARRGPRAVRRARLRGGDDGRGRRARSASPSRCSTPTSATRSSSTSRAWSRRRRRWSRPSLAAVARAPTPADAPCARRARVLRVRRRGPRRLAGPVRRDAARGRRARAARRRRSRERLIALIAAAAARAAAGRRRRAQVEALAAALLGAAEALARWWLRTGAHARPRRPRSCSSAR